MNHREHGDTEKHGNSPGLFAGGHPVFGLALSLAIFCAAAPLFAQSPDVQVKATVSTEIVGVQDQFQLMVTVAGDDAGEARTPRLPRLQGLQVVAGPSLNTQYQWINGRSSTSRSFIYILLPQREGQFTIGPIEVNVGSRTYRTAPVLVRVTSAAAPLVRTVPANPVSPESHAPRRASGEEVLVAAEAEPRSAFSGQQVTLTYHLYTQVAVSGLQLQESPPLTGFWVENIDVPDKPTPARVSIDGKEYLDYVIKKQALFPNRPGKLKIPASTFAVSVKSTGDIFGFFAQADTIYRKTADMDLDIAPLPEQNRPAGFNNAVGVFTLTADVTKSSASAGDALSLKIRLAGRGNLKAIPDIPLPDVPELTVYSSKTEIKMQQDGDQIGGEKTWDYVIVAKAPGSYAIPPVSFSFFDPKRQKYEIVSTQPILLAIRPGAVSADGAPGAIQKQLTRVGTDIHYIRLTGDLQRASPPIYRQPWFHALWALSLAFNIGAFLIQRQRMRQAGDRALVRGRKARNLALARLRRAEKAGRGSARQFYDQAAGAFSGYLADRYRLPEISVHADGLESALTGRAVPDPVIGEAISVMQECDFGRFVSASDSRERQTCLADRMRRVIDGLERARK